MKSKAESALIESQITELLNLQKSRFEKNMNRHRGSDWKKLESKLRNNHVFVYHNGAESYYAVRGFRGILKF